VEAAEEGHTVLDLREGEDAGFEAVVQVGGEVGDFVGEVDELGFKGRELAEEVFGEFGVGGGGVVAGVLDDAFADGEGEIEAAKGGVSLLKPGDDAEGVEVVVEGEVIGVEAVVEGLLAGVAEGRVADVMGQGKGFSQLDVEAEDGGESARDLGDFKRVGETAAEVVGGGIGREAGEDLGFAGEAAKGAGVEDASGIASEGSAVRMRPLGVDSAGEFVVLLAGDGDAWG